MIFLTWLATPDGVTIATLIAGLFGQHFVRKRRASTRAEIDRWASTAAALVVLGIKRGTFTHEDQAVRAGLEKFVLLAKAAGVDVSPEHEDAALQAITDATIVASQTALTTSLHMLGATADAALERRKNWRTP